MDGGGFSCVVSLCSHQMKNGKRETHQKRTRHTKCVNKCVIRWCVRDRRDNFQIIIGEIEQPHFNKKKIS